MDGILNFHAAVTLFFFANFYFHKLKLLQNRRKRWLENEEDGKIVTLAPKYIRTSNY